MTIWPLDAKYVRFAFGLRPNGTCRTRKSSQRNVAESIHMVRKDENLRPRLQVEKATADVMSSYESRTNHRRSYRRPPDKTCVHGWDVKVFRPSKPTRMYRFNRFTRWSHAILLDQSSLAPVEKNALPLIPGAIERQTG